MVKTKKISIAVINRLTEKKMEMFACDTAIGTNFEGVKKLLSLKRKKYDVFLTKEEIKKMVATYYIFVKGFGEVTENNLQDFIENYY